MRKITSFFVLTSFVLSCIMPPQGFAQSLTAVGLMPQPGVQAPLSAAFMPAQLKGMVIHPNDPFKFDFIISRGDNPVVDAGQQDEYQKLIKYFLASLAIPDTDQWVNLSPYEQNRIIPDNFGMTEMGRDLLAQDYLLKQISATLTTPDPGLGKKFWDGVYEQAYQKFGTTDIPTDVINKVWVLPDSATIYEKDSTVYVIDMHLKVMMEKDYLASKQTMVDEATPDENEALKISQQVMRDVIIPAIEKEVNEGQNFAPVRQVYSGALLAAWYKRALKESILNKVYGDRSKVRGIDQDPAQNQEIYKQYVAAFQKGVFNMIKEDKDFYSQEIIPRKYFSGGFENAAQTFDKGQVTRVDLETAKASLQRVIPEGRSKGLSFGSLLVLVAVLLNPFNAKASDNPGAYPNAATIYHSPVVERQIPAGHVALISESSGVISRGDGGKSVVVNGSLSVAPAWVSTVMAALRNSNIAATFEAGKIRVATAPEADWNRITDLTAVTVPAFTAQAGTGAGQFTITYDGKNEAVLSGVSQEEMNRPGSAVNHLIEGLGVTLPGRFAAPGEYSVSDMPGDTKVSVGSDGLVTIKNVPNGFLRDISPRKGALTHAAIIYRSPLKEIAVDLKANEKLLIVASRGISAQKDGQPVVNLIVTVGSPNLIPTLMSRLQGMGIDNAKPVGEKEVAMTVTEAQSEEIAALKYTPEGSGITQPGANDQPVNTAVIGQTKLEGRQASPQAGISAGFVINSRMEFKPLMGNALLGDGTSSSVGGKDARGKYAVKDGKLPEIITILKAEGYAPTDVQNPVNFEKPGSGKFTVSDDGKALSFEGVPQSAIDMVTEAKIRSIEDLADFMSMGQELRTKMREQLQDLMEKAKAFRAASQEQKERSREAFREAHQRLLEGVQGGREKTREMREAQAERILEAVDRSQDKQPVGGIDLNTADMNLKIKRDGAGVPLPVSQQNLDNIRIDGLVPVILNIQPAANMPLFSDAGSSAPPSV